MPRTAIRPTLPAMLFALLLGLLPLAAHAQTEQQSLVDRATLTVQDMMSDTNNREARKLLKNAKGVMVCPRVFKAGFILGGEGGACVLTGRNDAGWSSPAFYGLGSGSVGFQLGVQDSQIIFLLLTDKGIRALMDSQFKFGADASIAVASIGAGVSGATTAALRADIVSFAQARGLFVRNMGDRVAVCPPLIINEEELGDLFGRLRQSLDATLADLRSEGHFKG